MIVDIGSLQPDLLGQNSLPVLRGHLALIMTSELAFEVGELLRDSLAVILQQLFLGFHNSQPVVYEHSRMLLLNLVHALVVDRYSQAENPSTLISQEDYEEALQVVELLKGRAKKQGKWVPSIPVLVSLDRIQCFTATSRRC